MPMAVKGDIQPLAAKTESEPLYPDYLRKDLTKKT